MAVGAYLDDSSAAGTIIDPMNDCAAASPAHCAIDSGAVYVYTRSGTTWPIQAYLKASNAEAGDWFGFAVALNADGSALAVGAIFEDSVAMGLNGDVTNNAVVDSGAGYQFLRRFGTWTQQSYIKASNPGVDDRFGIALGLSSDGETLVIGAPRENSSATGLGGDQASNATEGAGAVYLY